MNRTDRLTGILLALQAGPRSASVLAERFEVSRRTIMRDVDSLGELGIPIIAESGRNGGYRIADGFWMPPMHLTADEATVLLFALEHVGPSDRSPLGDAHRSVLEKLRAILTPGISPQVTQNLESLDVLRPRDAPDENVIAAMRRAHRDKEWIAVTYQGPTGISERTILPIRIYTAGGRWYVEAADSLREAMRIFRISRILSTHRTIPPPNASDTLDQVNALNGTYHHPENPLIEVQLTENGVAIALDHPDFHQHLQGSIISFRCPTSEIAFYGREIIRFGNEATILNSPELRSFVQTHLASLLAHHGSTSESDPISSSR